MNEPSDASQDLEDLIEIEQAKFAAVMPPVDTTFNLHRMTIGAGLLFLAGLAATIIVSYL